LPNYTLGTSYIPLLASRRQNLCNYVDVGVDRVNERMHKAFIPASQNTSQGTNLLKLIIQNFTPNAFQLL